MSCCLRKALHLGYRQGHEFESAPPLHLAFLGDALSSQDGSDASLVQWLAFLGEDHEMTTPGAVRDSGGLCRSGILSVVRGSET